MKPPRPTVKNLALDAIAVGTRHRQDMGDLAALAASIEARGLLQPIGVNKDKLLVFGERRLRAVRMLGWEEIPATIIDLDSIVQGEWDENELHKAFTPSERVAIARAIEQDREERRGRPQQETASARAKKQRKKKTSQGGRKAVSGDTEFLQGEETRAAAAKGAGFSQGSYDRASKVVDNATPEVVEAMDAGKLPIKVASEVADLPEDRQREVIEKIEEGEKPRAALQQVKQEMAAVLDAIGLAVPEKLLDVFAVRADFEEIEKLRRQLARRLDEVAHKTGGAHLARALKTTQQGEKVTYKSTQLEDLKAILKETVPHSSVCPWCHSKHPGRYERACKACHGHGWVTYLVWRQTPAEEKEGVEGMAAEVTQETAS